MAATITNKYSQSSGVFECWIGTDNTTNPNTQRQRVVEVRVHKHVYDALAAAGKADIDAVTIANIIAEAFD